MGSDSSWIAAATNTLGRWSMGRIRGSEYSHMPTQPFTKDSGMHTRGMDMGLRFSMMEQHTMEDG
jgi:hypothetical protein